MTAKEALKDLREVRGWNDKEYNKRLDIIESALNRLEELEQIAIKGFNPNTDEYEYGQLFYSKENGYEVKNKNGDLLTNVMIQKANDDYFKMKNVLNIIKDKRVDTHLLFLCNTVNEYNKYDEEELTETEFKLLKECLK